MRHTLFLMIVVGSLYACSTQPAENLSLSPAEFKNQSESTPGAVLLDVRTAEELQDGYIKGALNMDFKRPEFKLLIAGMDKNKPYFVYCLSGMRSGKAAELMRESGFTHVTTLDGGIKAWKAAGMETVLPAPAP